MKETDVLASIDEEVERDQDPVVTVGPGHARLDVDHRLLLALVDLAVHRQSVGHPDHRYRSDLVVVLRNVDRTTDREAVVSPSAGTSVVLKMHVIRYAQKSFGDFPSFVFVL